jgi:glycosyltransferase involved in cell wall biosynthesis
MKILYVLENYYPFVGGVETLFQNICEGMAKKGHKVIVICQSNYKVAWHKSFSYVWGERINDVDVIRIACPNRYMFTLRALLWVIRKAKDINIIHTSTYTGAFPAWLASKIYRKPCVITVHEVLGDRWKKFGFKNAWLLELLEKIILKLGFDKYISVSQSTQRQLKIMGIESEVIYNGIDYEHWNPDKYELIRLNEGFTYLYFGRPGITKGVQLLLNAASYINEIDRSTKLVMILSAEPKDQRQEVVSLIKALGLREHVILMESVKYSILPRYIKGADCVVVPSLSEGFGYSCAEACAMSIPVVVTNVDSLPEVVSNKYLLVNPNVKSISDGIYDVYKGNYRNTRLNRFEWIDCVDKYDNIYRRLI